MVKLITAILLFVIVQFVSAQKTVLFYDGNEARVKLETSSSVYSIFPSANNYASGNLTNTIASTEDLSGSGWNLNFTASGKVFKDVSFANANTGYIVTELGTVFKTTNGGINWVTKLNLGFPYYWYGVHALSPDTVIISGFNNQGDIHSGVVRWTYNGGTTWSPDITLYITGGVGWLDRVHFYDRDKGIVFAGFSGAAHYTVTGGKDSASWNYVQINSDLAWFAGNYDFQNSGNLYASGIHFAHSTNFGVNWSTFNSADNVFDGGADFIDNNNNFGWTGGGQISAPVSGWVHRTTDGGTSWSDRLNTFTYPIRAVKFFDVNSGLVCGGNVYSEEGGIYSTSNGGTDWNLDINTSAEMFSMINVNVSIDSMDIWCVGSTGGSTGFIGKAYKKRTAINPVGIGNTSLQVPDGFYLYQNYPNPFNPVTIINYRLAVSSFISLKIYNVLGKEIITLVNGKQNAGTYSAEWNADNFPGGIYFYTLESDNIKETKKMLLVK